MDEQRIAEIESRFGFAVEDLAEMAPGWSVRENMEAALTDIPDLIAAWREQEKRIAELEAERDGLREALELIRSAYLGELPDDLAGEVMYTTACEVLGYDYDKGRGEE